MLIQKLFNSRNKIALQFMLVLYALALNHFLSKFTFFLLFFMRFITANMDVFAWKELHHLCEYILKKCECLFTGTINIFKNTPGRLYVIIFIFFTTQFRVGCKCCRSVSRHLNFWYNSDMLLLS